MVLLSVQDMDVRAIARVVFTSNDHEGLSSWSARRASPNADKDPEGLQGPGNVVEKARVEHPYPITDGKVIPRPAVFRRGAGAAPESAGLGSGRLRTA